MEKVKLLRGDCLELMSEIPDHSVDLILCDLPYGTTACKWDVVIPFEPLWEHYWRVLKPNGAVVLFGSEPFSSYLRMSQIKRYKYDWVWDKVKPSTGLNAKHSPLRVVENICIFGDNIQYKPQMYVKKIRKEKKHDRNGEAFGNARVERFHDNKGLGYPKNLIELSNADNTNRCHPTQKPVALLEYLIKTYTNENETVLDNCMGSGSTGVACVNTNRNFIGIEKDDKYFEIAQNRLKEAING